MSVHVLGLEGSIPSGTLVAWGAAAIADGGGVRNSHTGAVISRREAERLAGEGHLTLLDGSIEIDERYRHAPILLTMVDRTLDHDGLFQPGTDQLGDAYGLTTDRWQYYVFTHPDEFSAYAQTVSSRVVHATYYAVNMTDETARDLLTAALVVQANSPQLNALMVHFARRPENARRLALASLKDDLDRDRFGRFLLELQGRDDAGSVTHSDLVDHALSDSLRVGYQAQDELAAQTNADFGRIAASLYVDQQSDGH